MINDIIPPNRLRGHSRDFHGSGPARSVVVMRRTTVRPATVGVIDPILLAPTPMVRAIESLSPVEKVEILQNALARARYELRSEGRKWRNVKLTAVR